MSKWENHRERAKIVCNDGMAKRPEIQNCPKASTVQRFCAHSPRLFERLLLTVGWWNLGQTRLLSLQVIWSRRENKTFVFAECIPG